MADWEDQEAVVVVVEEADDGGDSDAYARIGRWAERDGAAARAVDRGEDWSPPLPRPPPMAADGGERADDEELEEQEEAREAAADRPVLLVNWTAATGGAVTRARLMEDSVDHAAWDELRRSVIADFNLQSELLFERRHALHSTELRWEADAARLAQLHPLDHFGAVPYPALVADDVVDVDEAWRELMRPSTFSVVTAIKQVLSQSSHTLLWKVLMAEELEELAAWQKAQRASGAGSPPPPPARDGPGTALAGQFDAAQLSVLDKSLAMILDRMPQFQSDQTHVEDNARRHMILKQMWMREFGGLPDQQARRS